MRQHGAEGGPRPQHQQAEELPGALVERSARGNAQESHASQKPEEDVYQTLDALKLSVPHRELLGHTKLTVGAPAIVIGGKNIGKYGKVVTIEKRPNQKRRDLLVTIEDKKGDQFQTILDFVFVIGDKEPSISLPEA